MEHDETMSQDQAFTFGKPEEEAANFTFPDEQKDTAASQAETTEKETAVTSSTEKETEVVAPKADAEDEQRVPYSRFKKVVEERDGYESRIKALEDSLNKPKPQKETTAEDVPPEWVELYGNEAASIKAWKLQQRREEQLRQAAVKETIELINKERDARAAQEKENEKTLEEYLSSLETALGGKKLTDKLEQDLLTIVDEFSPTNADGTYSSLIPAEKALEIYELRQSKKAKPTNEARKKVAELTGGKSEGEADTSNDSSFKRGWDNWREQLS